MTTDDVGRFNDTITLTRAYYSFLEKQTLSVQQIKGSTAQTQGPDGTLSSTSLNSVKMILVGLNRLKEELIQLNPEYLSHIKVRSLLTLFVENQYERWKYRHTNHAMRFPRYMKELLK